MANICDNLFYAESENKENLDHIEKFLVEVLDADLDRDEETIDATFSSRWTFPLDLMEGMFDGLPDKEHIYMRCLSYEFGCLYHDLHVCDDEDGWRAV